MITRKLGLDVGRINLREVSGSSDTVIPAFASIGKVSSKMRPLDKANVIILDMALLFHANDVSAYCG